MRRPDRLYQFYIFCLLNSDYITEHFAARNNSLVQMIANMNVYFISGLGADSRVFRNIILPEGNEIIYLDWINPLKKESLASYAFRLSERIDTGQKFALVGLSMGGMIATEISKQLREKDLNEPAITILLSSVPSHKHFPFHFKIAGYLRLYKLVPVALLKKASILNRFFSTDTIDDRKLLEQVIRDSDPGFIKWAIEAILTWRNETSPQHCIHIHGSKDRILPIYKTSPTHIINNGKHLMIMERAGELNAIIAEAIGKV